jgi:Trk K+ transport system NAD-binding subunit
MVENYLDRPGVAELFEISSGVASLVGMVVPDKAKVAEKCIRDIEIPKNCVVAAVVRGKEFVVPRGETVIKVGDHVVFVGPVADIKEAQDLFMLRD